MEARCETAVNEVECSLIFIRNLKGIVFPGRLYVLLNLIWALQYSEFIPWLDMIWQSA